MNKAVTFTIIPNDERVIIALLKTTRETSPVLMPGQLKAGDALHCGEIIHPGNTKFQKGQVVYYSEYSAAKLVNVGAVLRGEIMLGEAMRERDVHVVAADDIMAYEENVFNFSREAVSDDHSEVSPIAQAG